MAKSSQGPSLGAIPYNLTSLSCALIENLEQISYEEHAATLATRTVVRPLVIEVLHCT